MLRKYICANDAKLVEADEVAQILLPSRALLHALAQTSLSPILPFNAPPQHVCNVSADHCQGLKTMRQNLTPDPLQWC